MIRPNIDPANLGVMARRVDFETINLDNNNEVIEPYTVTISNPGGATIIPIVGNKMVIPLTNNTSEGGNYLKLHLPQPNSSEFYITFCSKTMYVQDGYYDFSTGVSPSFRTDLRTWILNGVLPNINAQQTIERNIIFTVYGLDTNIVSSAVQYTINFTAIYGSQTGPEGLI